MGTKPYTVWMVSPLNTYASLAIVPIVPVERLSMWITLLYLLEAIIVWCTALRY